MLDTSKPQKDSFHKDLQSKYMWIPGILAVEVSLDSLQICLSYTGYRSWDYALELGRVRKPNAADWNLQSASNNMILLAVLKKDMLNKLEELF